MRMTMTRERRRKMRKRMMHCSLTPLRGEERFCCNDGETSLPLEKVSHHNFTITITILSLEKVSHQNFASRNIKAFI